MTISTKKISDELQSIANGIDFTGLMDGISDVTTNLEGAGKSLIGQFSGQIKGGIEGLAPQLTTLTDQAKSSLEPVMAKVTADMPGAAEHLVQNMDAAGVSRIAEMADFDGEDLLSDIMPTAKTAMASADTMLNSIIADGNAKSIASSLESVTGESIEKFEGVMKELTLPEFQNDILNQVTSLKENLNVKAMTDQLGALQKSFASATGPFGSGNFLKDIVENKSFSITNNLRGIIDEAGIPELELTGITNTLMSGDVQSAVGSAMGKISVPDNLKQAATAANIPFENFKTEKEVSNFVEKMKIVSPEVAASSEVATYEQKISDVKVQVSKTKSDVTNSIKDEAPDTGKTDTNVSSINPEPDPKPKSPEVPSNAVPTSTADAGVSAEQAQVDKPGEVTTIENGQRVTKNESEGTTTISEVPKPEVPKKYTAIRSANELLKIMQSCNREVTTLVIHSSGQGSGTGFGPDEMEQAYANQGKTSPYHFLIARNGKIFNTTNIRKETAHTDAAFRPLSISLVYIGGIDRKSGKGKPGPNDRQFSQMGRFLQGFYQNFGAGSDVFGQSDLSNGREGGSPGFDVINFIETILGKTNTCVPTADGKFLTRFEIIDRIDAQYDHDAGQRGYGTGISGSGVE